jgi:hypothetical protein
MEEKRSEKKFLEYDNMENCPSFESKNRHIKLYFRNNLFNNDLKSGFLVCG